jgi:hypothetical protein
MASKNVRGRIAQRTGDRMRSQRLSLLQERGPIWGCKCLSFPVDIIDFEYRYWHKADDLPENCSAESLAEVGRVVTAWLALPRDRTRR